MTTRTPNHRLRTLLTEANLTYEATARAVRTIANETGEHPQTNKSTVHHWATYGTTPNPTTAHYLAEALTRRLRRPITPHDLGFTNTPPTDTTGLTLDTDPTTTLATLGEGDMKRRAFLTTAAYSIAAATLPTDRILDIAARTTAARHGATIGTAEINAVRSMVDLFTEMDERLGGHHGRKAFLQYLITDITPLCHGRFHTQQHRQQMLSTAASAAHLAGWKAYDSGEQGLAQRYYMQSYALATEAHTPAQDAFALRTMSQQSMKLHHPHQGLNLATESLHRAQGHVPTHIEALFHITHAHALAAAGHHTQAQAAMATAHTKIATTHTDETPPWALAWGPPDATVASRTAKVHEALGNHHNAEDHYLHAAATRPHTYTRITALDLTAAAQTQLKQGKMELACDTWTRAIAHMDGISSSRTRKAIRTIRDTLTPYKGRGPRCAVELHERATTILQAQQRPTTRT